MYTGGAVDIGPGIGISVGNSGWHIPILDILHTVAGGVQAEQISSASGAEVQYIQVNRCGHDAISAALASAQNLRLMVITATSALAQPFVDINCKIVADKQTYI